MREKCPNTKYGVLLRENTDQKKLRIWTLFTHFVSWRMTVSGDGDSNSI